MTTGDPARPATEGEYVTRLEAARRLGISTRQLDRLVSLGKITKYVKTVGRQRVYYLSADLTALLEVASANDAPVQRTEPVQPASQPGPAKVNFEELFAAPTENR